MVMHIRPADTKDIAVIESMIAELAAYERLAREAVASPADLDRALFGPSPRVFSDIAEIDGAPVGFALWFYSFSTFVGRHGIYLEDLYVRPEARGLGAGRALLSDLARRCTREGLGRLEWAVLDWNEPAIRFYDRIGSVDMQDWRMRRLSGAALQALGDV